MLSQDPKHRAAANRLLLTGLLGAAAVIAALLFLSLHELLRLSDAADMVLSMLLCAAVFVLFLLEYRIGRRLLEVGRRDLTESEQHVLQQTERLAEANAALQREIAERARTEDALRASESRIRGIVETAVDGIITIDEHGTIESVNPAVQKIFGFTPDELVGQNVSILMPEPYRREHDQYLENYRRTGQRKIIGIGREVVGQRKNGTTFPIDLAVSEVQLGARRIFTGTVRDITERKEAERERERLLVAEKNARREMEASVRELEAFSYSVSHDLRAPLRAIAGFAKILAAEHEQELSPEARELLQRVRESAGKMDLLITDLLAFSRVSRQSVEMHQVSMAQLAREAARDLEHTCAGRQIEIVFGDMPEAYGDTMLLKQVWMNLLSNAIKYTSKKEQARIETGWEQQDSGGAYYVRDNGVGFNMKYAHKLFRVFQRLHGEKDFEGTGVGLAIVARILSRHAGRIWAQAEPGHGATFYFTVGEGVEG